MTNSTPTSMQTSNHGNSRVSRNSSDAAPMVITRLSGWMDVNEMKPAPRAWIVPTRIDHSAR